MDERDQQTVLHEGFLMKKCKRKTWKMYWVVLKDQHLFFFVQEDAFGSQETATFAGSIALTANSKCIVEERQGKYQKSRKSEQDSFKFKLKTKNGVYLLKTESELERKTWVTRLCLSVASVEPNETIGILNESTTSSSQPNRSRVLSSHNTSRHYELNRIQKLESRSKAGGSSREYSYGSLREENEISSENLNICRRGSEPSRGRFKPLSQRLTNSFRTNAYSRSVRRQGYEKQL